MKIAGAPITWGVCEVPGWGYQMSRERVLTEMAALGFSATELGPDGFLPDDPQELVVVLDKFNLGLIAGFTPVVLHDKGARKAELSRVRGLVERLAHAGAEVLVVAAATGRDDYEEVPSLTEREILDVVDTFDRIRVLSEERGLLTTLHPHYGTMIGSPDSLDLLMETDISLCLDTGHLAVCGVDPVSLAKTAANRVSHVHLKDVDLSMARRVQSRQVGYQAAVSEGLFKPLGRGDIELGEILDCLEGSGFEGWYVLEQDTVLEGEPVAGTGPVLDAKISLEALESHPDGW